MRSLFVYTAEISGIIFESSVLMIGFLVFMRIVFPLREMDSRYGVTSIQVFSLYTSIILVHIIDCITASSRHLRRMESQIFILYQDYKFSFYFPRILFKKQSNFTECPSMKLFKFLGQFTSYYDLMICSKILW